MIFFELRDIEGMLATSHDPIGDFINAATSDVVVFMSKHDFESFKQNTEKLNDLATYKQLSMRGEQSDTAGDGNGATCSTPRTCASDNRYSTAITRRQTSANARCRR